MSPGRLETLVARGGEPLRGEASGLLGEEAL